MCLLFPLGECAAFNVICSRQPSSLFVRDVLGRWRVEQLGGCVEQVRR